MAAPKDSPLVFDDEGLPRSRLYDDIYFSREDGLAESQAVFLRGCGLPGRWAGRRRFTVGELGFGTGLNIAALLDLWRTSRDAQSHLWIFSVEAHPVDAAQAAQALSRWPALAEVAALLVKRWPGRRAGFHRIDLPEFCATLDVAVLEASQALREWQGLADVWFLDGFAPAKNPAMWSDELISLVAQRSAPGARAATFTVAGHVRRALTAAGFETARRPGFGAKRERLEATLPPLPAGEEKAPRVAVIGAGIAGAALARAFAALGLEAEVFEAVQAGAGASGNPAAVVTPRLDAGLGAAAQLHVQAFERAAQLYDTAPGAVIARGALQLEADPRDAARFAKIAHADLFAPGALCLVTSAVASARLGEAAPGGVAFHGAPVIDPAAVLGAWLPVLRSARVAAVEPSPEGWRLQDEAGALLAEVDVVCLATGAELADLWPAAPVTPVRGQLSWVEGVAAPAAAAWDGYVAPMKGGMIFGATYDRDEAGGDWRAADDERNLAVLGRDMPNLAARLAGRRTQGRASVRATVPDQAPIAGRLAPGLFVLGALGSRGFTLAPLLAEHLVALALGAPSPLPASLAALVAPARFEERARRRKRLEGVKVVL
ncbi:MAG: tRNA (5-methylaminomethyl-2-thiouridine)(34)-methyltransferase MnmD [Caulobacterales bacterium]